MKDWSQSGSVHCTILEAVLLIGRTHLLGMVLTRYASRYERVDVVESRNVFHSLAWSKPAVDQRKEDGYERELGDGSLEDMIFGRYCIRMAVRLYASVHALLNAKVLHKIYRNQQKYTGIACL